MCSSLYEYRPLTPAAFTFITASYVGRRCADTHLTRFVCVLFLSNQYVININKFSIATSQPQLQRPVKQSFSEPMEIVVQSL